jgi:hypothetical protein
MNASNNMDTDEYTLPTSQTAVLSPRVAFSAVQVDLAALSHPGKVRPNNEDHFLVVHLHRALQTLLTNLPEGVVPLRAEEVGYGMLRVLYGEDSKESKPPMKHRVETHTAYAQVVFV